MKLSIITICFNNLDGLRKTFDSVVSQTFKDYEFIIIDGGSSDGTKEFLEEHDSQITYWCSEKDKGIYNAMNKGIDKVNGEYCFFLNSGDCFSDKKVLERVINNLNEDIIYGNIIRTKGRKKMVIKYPSKLTFYDFYKDTIAIHHQASFIKTSLFQDLGKYREDLYITADWDFFFKAIVEGQSNTRHIDTLISICDGTGSSCGEKSCFLEEKRLFDQSEKAKKITSYLPKLVLYDYTSNVISKDRSKSIWEKLSFAISPIIPMKYIIKNNI